MIRAQGAGGRIVRGAVLDARAQASRIVDEAREQAAALRKAARNEGRAEGLAEAHAQAVALLAAASAARAGALADAEREVLALSLRAAEQLLQQALEIAPERIEGVLQPLLARARNAQRLQLRVHPDDLTATQHALPRLQAELAASLALEPDPEVTRGGAILHSELGTLDGRLEVRLAALRRALGIEDE